MDLDSERVLVSALKGMSNLTSFQWTRPLPPLINRNREDDIWITFAKYCPSLNVIDVIDRERPFGPMLEEIDDDPAYQRPSHNPNFYLFKDLKSFSFKTEAFNVGNFALPDVEQYGKTLVERCPNLEALKLQYILYANPNTKTILSSPLLSGPPWNSLRWNSLRKFALSGFNFISTELSCHLASHPTIEVLSLRVMQIDQSLVLPPDALPRLKRLYTDLRSTVANSILDSTIATPRPLECIMGSLFNDLFLNSLEQCGSGPNLKTLVASCVYNPGSHFSHLITRLSAIAPNLEWLNVKVSGQIDHALYPVFGRSPHLRTIQGAVIIERNGSHGTWSLRKMVKGIEGSVYTHWGEKGHCSFEL
ncbi:hypothetical protein BYT27DRAFT_7183093 [Phlegmacium glaucopus]|nr:hypothetical protein BYT27DRAFT_7183093 [Phlegmacium glaucopus]